MPSPSLSMLPTPADLKGRRARLLRTVALMLGALLLITGLYWWRLEISAAQLRRETLAQAQLRAAQVNSASTEIISMLIHGIDFAAQELAEYYGQHKERGFDDKIEQVTQRLPEGSLLQVGVIDADGQLEYSNLDFKGKIDLSDREHFKVHLGTDLDQLFISRPVLGRVSGQWSIQFSRPIQQQGKFRGVIVLSVSPDFIRNSLAKLTLASDDSIALFRQSGELLARNNEFAGQMGQAARHELPFVGDGAASEGSFQSASGSGQMERIFQWQRLEDYPVTVVLGLSTTTVLKPIERALARDRLHAVMGTVLLWTSAILVIVLLRRVQVHRQKRREIEHVALHDTLTGLGNRHALLQQLERQVRLAEQEAARFGLLFIDLDRFKPINDNFGHAAGDTVLKLIAGRLIGCIRATDFPARIGGDEFVVLLKNIKDRSEASAMVGRITTALGAPVSIEGQAIPVGASIGIAIYPEDGSSATELLASADRVMYEDKRDRKHAGQASRDDGVLPSRPASSSDRHLR